MIFDPDKILNYFNNEIILLQIFLRVNIFPRLLYGFKYLRALNEIKKNKSYERKIIDYVNEARKSSAFYSHYPKR